MKIKYKFVTGERVEIEVNNEFAEIMIELESKLEKNNRKETRRHENLSSFDKDSKNSDFSADIYGKVLKSLAKDKLYTAVATLTPREQDLVHKLYLGNNPIPQAQYAKHLNIKEKSVQEKSRRIRRKLEKLMKNL